MKKPVVIAHRGASAYAPENTMSAFKKALDMGAGGIELDVHLSKDGRIVVIHDERIDRTSNGKGMVRDFTLDELKNLDFGSWFSQEYAGERIPLLEEVLELLNGWDGLLNIEIKSGIVLYPGIENKLVELVKKYHMDSKVIYSSFNHYSLAELKRIDPEAKIGLLYGEGLIDPWEYALRVGAYAIHPVFYAVVPDIVKGCRENGIAVNTFTVDHPEHILRMAEAGVDGIITNVPDIALKIIKERKGLNEA